MAISARCNALTIQRFNDSVQTADQARGKVGVVKWACAYGGGEDGSPSEARNAIQEARN